MVRKQWPEGPRGERGIGTNEACTKITVLNRQDKRTKAYPWLTRDTERKKEESTVSGLEEGDEPGGGNLGARSPWHV